MAVDPNIASVAALIAEPARAAMLTALLGRRPRAASELARCAGISPQTGSAHLARLVAGGLLSVTPNGRHRYYQLAGPHVAEVLEALAAIAPAAPIGSLRQFDEARAIRFARTCYDHLAGMVGVALTEPMLEHGLLLPVEHTYRVGDEGVAWLKREGLDAHQIFFFFQAEDGIRDHCVTGVQTCALPICVMLSYEGFTPGVYPVGGALLRERRVNRREAQNDLAVIIREAASGYTIWFEYSSEIGRASCRERV